jgi:hypothetical protein
MSHTFPLILGVLLGCSLHASAQNSKGSIGQSAPEQALSIQEVQLLTTPDTTQFERPKVQPVADLNAPIEFYDSITYTPVPARKEEWVRRDCLERENSINTTKMYNHVSARKAYKRADHSTYLKRGNWVGAYSDATLEPWLKQDPAAYRIYKRSLMAEDSEFVGNTFLCVGLIMAFIPITSLGEELWPEGGDFPKAVGYWGTGITMFSLGIFSHLLFRSSFKLERKAIALFNDNLLRTGALGTGLQDVRLGFNPQLKVAQLSLSLSF